MAINEQTGEYVATTPQVSTAIPQLTPAQVYSAPNIQQAATTPVAPPNLADPMGLYDYYMSSPEIQAAQKEILGITQNYNQALGTARAQQTAIENQPREGMAWIGTAQQRAGALANQQLQALSEAKLAQQSYLDTLQTTAKNKYAVASEQRAQLQDLIAQTGGKAGISYADTYESAVSKATGYLEKKAKDEKKDAYKDALKKMALEYGVKTKGKSTSQLEKAIAKYNKKAKSLAMEEAELSISKTKAEIAKLKSGGSGNEDKEVASFYTDAQKLRGTIQEGTSDWGYAWNVLRAQYPKASNETIDNALGMDLRSQAFGQ